MGDGRKFHYPSKNEWMMDMSFTIINKVMGDG